MKIHGLKTVQPYFGQVKDGTKTAELRKNDRDFKVGDYLLLQEFEVTAHWTATHLDGIQTVGHYTGKFVLVEVTDVCHYPDALNDGYVMLSFKKLEGQA